jgi:DNA replication protein DnaC
VKSPSNEEAKEIITKKIEHLKVLHNEGFTNCGERLEYNYCKIAEKLKRIYNQTRQPEAILYRWDIPSKHIKSSFDTFKGGESAKKICKEAVKNDESVLLTGLTGCGKTHLAVSMLRHLITSSTKPLYNDRYGDEKPHGLFITVPELLLEIRKSFNNKEEDESSIVDKYSRIPVLLLDDLGSEKCSEWSESTLYIIIDRRNRDEMFTIVTSNLTLEGIEQHLGARIASRLSDMKVINIKMPDYRKKR